MREQPERRERPRYVFARLPRCPACNSTKLRAYRTSRHGDDSLTRHSKCLACGQRLLIVLE